MNPQDALRLRKQVDPRSWKTNSTLSSMRPAAASASWSTNARTKLTSYSHAPRRLVAADTGAVDHVIPIGALPRGCVLDGVVERHFVGANDAHIEAYGGCDTLMSTREGPISCKY